MKTDGGNETCYKDFLMRRSYAFLIALIPLAASLGMVLLTTDPLIIRWQWFAGVVSAIVLGIYLANYSSDSNNGF